MDICSYNRDAWNKYVDARQSEWKKPVLPESSPEHGKSIFPFF